MTNIRTKRKYRKGIGIMLVNEHGHIFVAQRIDQKKLAWQMPQGGIDKNEIAIQAAVRELYEETGIKEIYYVAETSSWLKYEIPRKLRKKKWNKEYIGQRQKWFLMFFSGKDSSIDLRTNKPEFSEWRWIKPSNLEKITVSFRKKIYKEVLSEFSNYLRRFGKNCLN